MIQDHALLSGIRWLVIVIALGLEMMMGNHLQAKARESASSLEPAHEWVLRQGLPNISRKLQAGDPVSIVFLGGSITLGGEGSGGYIAAIRQWFQKTYPSVKFSFTNSGIPGTGSDFGVRRYDRDVLSQKPDLVFIEFAVNDGDRDLTVEMERMVHKTWLANPCTDIVIYYTLHQNHLPDYQQGRLPKAASCHERVAAFYGIPTVGPAYGVYLKLAAGQMTWPGFSQDTCHPAAEGQMAFAQAFNQALPKLLERAIHEPHELGRSITANLVVYPPPIQARELDRSIVLVTRSGHRALETYPLPVPGIHWRRHPDFVASNGKPLWRLSWMKRPSQAESVQPLVGCDPTAWDGHAMEWLEEDGGFSGNGGKVLVAGSGKNAMSLGCAGTNGVLRFVVPETGRYAVQLHSAAPITYQHQEHVCSLNVIHVSWKNSVGKSLAFYKHKISDKKPLDEEVQTDLLAGEELVFVCDSSTPSFLLTRWPDLHIGIGRLEPTSSQAGISDRTSSN